MQLIVPGEARVPIQVVVLFSASVGAVRFLWKALRSAGRGQPFKKPAESDFLVVATLVDFSSIQVMCLNAGEGGFVVVVPCWEHFLAFGR